MSLFDDDDNFDSDETESNTASLRSNNLEPPHKNHLLYGHTNNEKTMIDLWNEERIPHAIILNGIKGIGKATYAYRLARFLLEENGNSENSNALFEEEISSENLTVSPESAIFKKVASGGHTDLMVLERPFDDKKGHYKDEISVDQIRKVAPFLRKTSGNGGWRIVIIDDANTMNRNGQNALLKILEEPPKKTLLMLVTHGAGGLLPTIRSRCHFLSFNPLDDENMRELTHKASDYPLTDEDMAIIAILSEGSAGKAVDLVQNGGMENAKNILNMLLSVQDLSLDQIDSLALTYGKSGDKNLLNDFIFVISWWIQLKIKMIATGETKKAIGDTTIIVKPYQSLPKLLKLYEELEQHIQTCLNSSLDKRYMVFKTLRILQDNND